MQTQNARPCALREEEDEAGRREKEEKNRTGQGRAGQEKSEFCLSTVGPIQQVIHRHSRLAS